MSYKRNYPNSCSLFRKRSLKEVKANFCVDLHFFHNLPSVLSFLNFVTECFDKNGSTRLMIHQSYFFINVLLIHRSRLSALISCICGTEICV